MKNRDQQIIEMVQKLADKMITRRRDIHKHAEAGWTEFRTASIVAETLDSLGFQVLVGDQVLNTAYMMGMPSKEQLAKHQERALQQGAISRWVEKMEGGKTAVVGVMKFAKPGPTVGFRFDMDANDVTEAKDIKHRPYREGFASVNDGAHHGCGHDGHTSMGLTVAEVLANLKGQLTGTVKLVFQPAEEGLRGGRPVAESGVLDDVDYMMGVHLGAKNARKVGQLCCEVNGWLASTKFDVEFTGLAAHAGGDPEKGKNALLAAATALLNMHAIPRHSQGASRINVGVLQGGTGRNVIPDKAVLKVETRGATTEIDKYIYEQAVRIAKAVADMYDIDMKIVGCGGAAGCVIDKDIVDIIKSVAERMGMFEVLPYGISGGSEDYTHLMERVQKHGGKATAIRVGTEFYGAAHNPYFDFDEKALSLGASFIAGAIAELLDSK